MIKLSRLFSWFAGRTEPARQTSPGTCQAEPQPVWPNGEEWSALSTGRVEVGGEVFALETVDCGILKMPTGQLVCCDPFAAMDKTGNAFVEIPPGEYPVVATVADVSQNLDGSHLREAYASLLLSVEPEVFRAPLSPCRPGQSPPALEPGTFIGFPVDAGTACFVDAGSLASGMPPEDGWLENLFDCAEPHCWFEIMDDPDHIRAGLANIQLPLSTDGANLVLFHSGWGDGHYPVIGGYSSSGELVAVHVDFFVVVENVGE